MNKFASNKKIALLKKSLLSKGELDKWDIMKWMSGGNKCLSSQENSAVSKKIEKQLKVDSVKECIKDLGTQKKENYELFVNSSKDIELKKEYLSKLSGRFDKFSKNIKKNEVLASEEVKGINKFDLSSSFTTKKDDLEKNIVPLVNLNENAKNTGQKVSEIEEAGDSTAYSRLISSLNILKKTAPLSEVYQETPANVNKVLLNFRDIQSVEQSNILYNKCLKIKADSYNNENRYPVVNSYNKFVVSWFEYLDSIGTDVHSECLNGLVSDTSSKIKQVGSLSYGLYSSDGDFYKKYEHLKTSSETLLDPVNSIEKINFSNSFSKEREESLKSINALSNYIDSKYDEFNEKLEDIPNKNEEKNLNIVFIKDIVDSKEFSNAKQHISKLDKDFDVINKNSLNNSNNASSTYLFSSLITVPGSSISEDNPVVNFKNRLDSISDSISSLFDKNLKCKDFMLPENKIQIDSIENDLIDLNTQSQLLSTISTASVQNNFDSFYNDMNTAELNFNNNIDFDYSTELINSIDCNFASINNLQMTSGLPGNLKTDLINQKFASIQNSIDLLNNNINKATDLLTPDLGSATQSLCDATKGINNTLNQVPQTIDPSFTPIANNQLMNKIQGLQDAVDSFSVSSLDSEYAYYTMQIEEMKNSINNIMNIYALNSINDVDLLKSKLEKSFILPDNSIESKLNVVNLQINSLCDKYSYCSNISGQLNNIHNNFIQVNDVHIPKMNNPKFDIRSDYYSNLSNAKDRVLNFNSSNPIINKTQIAQEKLNLLKSNLSGNFLINNFGLDSFKPEIPSNLSLPLKDFKPSIPFPGKMQMLNCLSDAESAINSSISSAEKVAGNGIKAVSSGTGQLICNKGIAPIPYQIMPTGQDFGPGKTIGGVLLMTMVPSFGGCLNNTNPAAPAQMYCPPYQCMGGMMHGPFSPGSDKVMVAEAISKALTENCKCDCLLAPGGKISINSPGQSETVY